MHQQLIDNGRTATLIGDAACVRNLHAAVTEERTLASPWTKV